MSKSLLTLPSHPVELYSKFSTYKQVRNQVKKQSHGEHFQKHAIIFGLAWVTGDSATFLTACTGEGELIVWKVPVVQGDTQPIFRCKVSQGKLYTIKLERVASNYLLIMSGDDGVLVFDWERDILQSHLQQQSSSKAKQPEFSVSPVSTFQTHPSPLESRKIEVNDFEVLEQGNNQAYLFGAAGDSFGAYKWDLATEKLVANYASAGGGYLHALRLLPADNESDSQQTLLAGGEGGKLRLWNVNSDKLMDQIDLAAATISDLSSGASPTLNRNNSKRSKNTPSRWISSICAYDHNWVSVGGGSSGGGGGGSSRGGSSTYGGFLATYHAPTRSLVSLVETRETPQQLTILPPSAESVSEHNLVSVANEGVVSHFNALTLERNRRVWSTPPSSYAVAVSDDGKYTAVAGVGQYVDLFSPSGEKAMRLSIC